ncbi:MAG: nicotinamide N-methylase [Alphaproteobacteria bacterium]|nr:nicotinamide N-methylase [Alphaproteobacteria bacterium]
MIDDFIRANTVLQAPSMVPELRLHLATEITPIWRASEADLERMGVPPPYWAFCWPGGQAIARHILDHPELVRGRRVLDFAAGSGMAAFAAVKAGAVGATGNDIDAYAVAAIRLNAEANGLAIKIDGRDLLVLEAQRDFDVILAGDVCYERPLAETVFAWLQAQAKLGALVLLGDPGRPYKPTQGIAEMARYDIPTSLQLENHGMKETIVWRVLP